MRADWEPVWSQVISTPAIAKVQYTNGIEILVQPNKLQVSDGILIPGSESDTSIWDIAIKFVKTLQHVRYTAVGINFTGFVVHADAESYIFERFLKPGSWTQTPNAISSTEVKFIYTTTLGKMTLAVAGGQAQKPSEAPQRGMILECNLHNDLPAEKPVSSAEAHLAQYRDVLDLFYTMSQQIVGSV